MKDDKKYHRGGSVPTPRGQVPHPPRGRGRGRKGLTSTELQKRMELARARKRRQQDAMNRRLRGGRLQPAPPRRGLPQLDFPRPMPMPMPMQPPRPTKGATPIQATPQPMPMPAQRTDRRGQPMETAQISSQPMPASSRPMPAQRTDSRGQPMETPQAVPLTGARLSETKLNRNAGTPRPRRKSGKEIREDMNRRMRRTRKR